MRHSFLLLAIFIAAKLYAVSAFPEKIPILINGTIYYIFLKGDENYKYGETEDGYTIVQNDDGKWCYAFMDKDNSLIPSDWGIETDKESDDFNSFITNIPKHLRLNNTAANNKNIEIRKILPSEKKVLVILMQYKDLPFVKTKEEFNRLFNGESYTEDGAAGSVKDFYASVSYGQMELQSDIYGPYTSIYDMSYYGKNNKLDGGKDSNPYALFIEAINNVSKETDLKKYDDDGDGIIDNVHIVFAGYGEEAGASSNAIWSHECRFSKFYQIGDVLINQYSCAPELRGNTGLGISRIGPHCHEIGHALGASDYYDVDYEIGGKYVGTGKWDIMASGSWNNSGVTPADFNPYVKSCIFGWVSPNNLPPGEVIIKPSSSASSNYYTIQTVDGDIFMLENRNSDLWGAALPGHGLLIYHIHNNVENQLKSNNINSTHPQMTYLICASSNNRIPNSNPTTYGDINSDGCPFPGSSNNSCFAYYSTPAAFLWSGNECHIDLSEITLLDNGDIRLLNNSKTDGEVDINLLRIFFEDFESGTQVLVNNSESESWVVVDEYDKESLNVKRPIAYSGIKSIQLSSNESGPVIASFSFSTTNKCVRKKIRFMYNSYKRSFSETDILKLYYQTADKEEWSFVDINANERNKWIPFEFDLPNDANGNFIIEGHVIKGSTIAIDDIEVFEYVNDDTHIDSPIYKSSNVQLYNTSGMKMLNITNGVVIMNKNGLVKKILQ